MELTFVVAFNGYLAASFNRLGCILAKYVTRGVEWAK